MVSSSHLRGTCLLTGQQATVDITSNYKTSLTMFSSVNMLFMLTVVLWISASFALFYTGGLPQSKDESRLIQSERIRAWTGDVCMEMNGASCCSTFKSADLVVIVAVVWNAALIIYVMIPKVILWI